MEIITFLRISHALEIGFFFLFLFFLKKGRHFLDAPQPIMKSSHFLASLSTRVITSVSCFLSILQGVEQ